MTDFIGLIYNNYHDIIRIIMFNFLKTGNPIYDTLISTFVISILGVFINYIYEYGFKISTFISFHDIKDLFFKKNMIIIEGKRNCGICKYNSNFILSSAYSVRFKAFCNYIITNIFINQDIHTIKEIHSNLQSSENGDDKRKKFDIFMVHQKKYFNIDNNIFVKINTETETIDDKKETKVEKSIIQIYSYNYSIGYLKSYIDNITEKYLTSIKDSRSNKQFIYFLEKPEKIKNKSQEEILNTDYWREDMFETSRTFDNIFFDGKNHVINKIDFFLKNREWYYNKGIPYSLGIGLHGPPGTGKTSFIKALANYTKRHIIVISFKIIKTKSHLEEIFFENTYNVNNEINSITFDKKIIVFEDIDCIGDIVLDRNKKTKGKNLKNNQLNVNNFMKTICEFNTENDNILNEELITLDDILNLWDGIRETPGRILIISSNHYNKLDSALIRPGRIDISHELSNASHNTIAEIYFHLFEKEIDKKKLSKIKEYFYSPAELINMYVKYKKETEFIDRLLENRK